MLYRKEWWSGGVTRQPHDYKLQLWHTLFYFLYASRAYSILVRHGTSPVVLRLCCGVGCFGHNPRVSAYQHKRRSTRSVADLQNRQLISAPSRSEAIPNPSGVCEHLTVQSHVLIENGFGDTIGHTRMSHCFPRHNIPSELTSPPLGGA